MLQAIAPDQQNIHNPLELDILFGLTEERPKTDGSPQLQLEAQMKDACLPTSRRQSQDASRQQVSAAASWPPQLVDHAPARRNSHPRIRRTPGTPRTPATNARRRAVGRLR